MLVFSIKDEAHNKIDGLSESWYQFINSLNIIELFVINFLEFFYFLFDELVLDDGIPSDLGDQKHNFLHFIVDFLLELCEALVCLVFQFHETCQRLLFYLLHLQHS